MTEEKKLVTNPESHSVKSFIRGNEIFFVCDGCGKEFKQSEITKINSGKTREYAYCEACMKVKYPKYKKISFYNPNPVMNTIMRDSLARKEYGK